MTYTHSFYSSMKPQSIPYFSSDYNQVNHFDKPRNLSILRHTLKQKRTNYKKFKKTTQQKVSQNSAEQNNTYNFYTRLNSKPQQQNSDRTTNQSTQQRFEIHFNT